MTTVSSRPRPRLNGFLNINKPGGCTSMDVVRRVKGLSGQRRRVGHGGTLDPLAQGVLAICFGQATRLMETLIDNPKLYSMTVQLGITTSTYDAEGQVVDTSPVGDLTREEIERVMASFCGTIQQVPPMYSALKHQGKRLYELARAGVDVERQPRQVQVFSMELVKVESPFITLRAECGRGVYMRSLAHELGQALGCGGHLTQLTREASGPFRVEDGVTPDYLEQLVAEKGPDAWMVHLKPVDYALLGLRKVVVPRAAERLLKSGQAVSLGPGYSQGSYLEKCRAYSSDGRFLAVIRFHPRDSQWKPDLVFQLEGPSPYGVEDSQFAPNLAKEAN